ncbi:MAG: hypothetical protein WCL49_07870 [bacterium]
MGLYDRDYMRDKPVPDDDEGPGLDRLASRRRRLIVAGVLILLAGIIAALVFN